jgi:hypothetical protein
MITESMVLYRLRIELGTDIFKVFPPEYFLDIINNETLYTWSHYYPQIIRGIYITKDSAIQSIHPQTGRSCIYKYKIPKETEDDTFIGIEEAFLPHNATLNQTFSNLPIMNSVLALTNPALPNAPYYNSIRYSALFAPPDIVYLDPIPSMGHLDFSLNMQRLCKLYEIPLYFRELFLQLCTCDIKIALFNEFKNLRDGSANYQGLEVNSYIGEFGEAKGERKELLEAFRKDFFKNPIRFSTNFMYVD